MSLPNSRTILDIDSYAPKGFRVPIVSRWRRPPRSHETLRSRVAPRSNETTPAMSAKRRRIPIAPIGTTRS